MNTDLITDQKCLRKQESKGQKLNMHIPVSLSIDESRSILSHYNNFKTTKPPPINPLTNPAQETKPKQSSIDKELQTFSN